MKSAEIIYLKIIRYGIYASLFVPLVIFKDFLSPFHFGKGVVFRSIIEFIAVFYILLIISDRKYRPNFKNPLILAFTIFTGLYILTSFTGVNLHRSFYGTLERMGGMFSFIHFWIFFIILASVIKDFSEWMRLLKLSVFVGLLSAFYALGQHWDIKSALGYQKDRVIGTMGNAALYGGYMLFVVFLSLYFFFLSVIKEKTDWIGTVFYGAVFFIGSYTIFLTAVRGSVGAWVVGMFVFTIYLAIISKKEIIKKITVFSLVSLIVLVSLFWALKDSDFVQGSIYLKRIAQTSLKADTIQTRLISWNSGFEGWKEKFWLGWGPENFSDLYAKYFNPKIFIKPGSEVVWDRAHNVFLNAGATMGIFGFLSYISLFVVAFWFLIKKYPKTKNYQPLLKITLITVIISYMVHNSFILDTTGNYLIFFLILGFIYFISKTDTKTPEESDLKESKFKPNIFLAGILLFTSSLIVYQYNIKPARANYTTTRGIVSAWNGDYNKALAYYQKALGYNAPSGQFEIRARLTRFVVDNIGALKLGDDEDKRRGAWMAFEFAEQELKNNIREYPLDPAAYLYLMRLHNLTLIKFDEPVISTEKIKELISKAIEISPGRQQIYYEAAQVHLQTGEYDEAVSLFERARDLSQEVAISHWYLGLGLAEAGRYSEARDSIEKAIEINYYYFEDYVDIGRAARVYLKLEDFQGLADYYKLTINKIAQPEGFDAQKLKEEKRKNFAQLHASLAAVYKQIGDLENAALYARKAGEIDEAYMGEADLFIKTLNR